VLLLLLLK